METIVRLWVEILDAGWMSFPEILEWSKYKYPMSLILFGTFYFPILALPGDVNLIDESE